MRTREEEQEAISRLESEKPHIPEYNAFGENNHRKIDLITEAIQEMWGWDEIDEKNEEEEWEHWEYEAAQEGVNFNEGNNEVEELLWHPDTDYRDVAEPEVAPTVQMLAPPTGNVEKDVDDAAEELSSEPRFCNKKTCGDCPFSNKSLRGFLADYTIEDFEKYQKAQLNFPCHKQMTGGDMSAIEAHTRVSNGEMPLCRGYVESLIKSGADVSNNETLQKAIETAKADGLNDNTMSMEEFKEFHDLKKIFSK